MSFFSQVKSTMLSTSTAFCCRRSYNASSWRRLSNSLLRDVASAPESFTSINLRIPVRFLLVSAVLDSAFSSSVHYKRLWVTLMWLWCNNVLLWLPMILCLKKHWSKVEDSWVTMTQSMYCVQLKAETVSSITRHQLLQVTSSQSSLVPLLRCWYYAPRPYSSACVPPASLDVCNFSRLLNICLYRILCFALCY